MLLSHKLSLSVSRKAGNCQMLMKAPRSSFRLKLNQTRSQSLISDLIKSNNKQSSLVKMSLAVSQQGKFSTSRSSLSLIMIKRLITFKLCRSQLKKKKQKLSKYWKMRQINKKNNQFQLNSKKMKDSLIYPNQSRRSSFQTRAV